MTLNEVKRILACDVIVGEDKLDRVVTIGCGADLMSDVLAFIKPGALLLTGLTNIQSIQTADVADARAIVYVRNKRPDADGIKLAREKGIPLLTTRLLMFEACGRLYVRGLRGGTEIATSDDERLVQPEL